MADQFDDLFPALTAIEGGYSNDPKDSGGETMHGITAIEARSNGYEGRMQDMPLNFAKIIYKEKYWTSPRSDEVGSISKVIAAELFDTAVNCGVQTAVKMFQRCLNVFNQEQKLYPDLLVDGSIGDKNLLAFKKHFAARDIVVFLKALNCLQGARYIELAERRVKDEKFIYGWIKNRI